MGMAASHTSWCAKASLGSTSRSAECCSTSLTSSPASLLLLYCSTEARYSRMGLASSWPPSSSLALARLLTAAANTASLAGSLGQVTLASLTRSPWVHRWRERTRTTS